MYVPYEHIPDFLKQATIAMEDSRFYLHRWIDGLALIRAWIENLLFNTKQGASTIDAQLIRNLFWLNERRTVDKKVKEFFLAHRLNACFSKDRILEMYLNTIYFWNMNYGIGQASYYYFWKPLHALTKEQMIALLAMMKNASYYDPFTKRERWEKRYERIVAFLEKKRILSSRERIFLNARDVTFQKHSLNTLPYVTDYLSLKVQSFSGSSHNFSLKTFIDIPLTQKIDKLAKQTLRFLKEHDAGDYGIIVVKREDLWVRVLIGGKDYFWKDGQVNAVFSLRQPGSALKPLLYALAFEKLGKFPHSSILDLPISFTTEEGYSYQPKNYSLDFKGEVTYAEALAQSLNVPAVRILAELWVHVFLAFLRQVWITSLTKSDAYYGLSLALWSGEVTLFELLQSYTIFSHEWNFCLFRFFQDEPYTCNSMIDKRFTDMVVSILSQRHLRFPQFPIGSNIDFPDRFVFIKTGTSRNFNDSWALWFTRNYLIGVWVGNKEGKEMKNITGASWAWEIFQKIVYILETQEEIQDFQHIPKKTEPFLEIISPLSESTFQYNPFIPDESQKIRLTFSTNIPYDTFVWKVNEKNYTGAFLSVKDLEKENSLEVILFQGNRPISSKKIRIFTFPMDSAMK